ncbi:MAG: N-acetyltransferase [Planctomycetota bacterium]|nr:MAG: N-acetyltransferase [Planctomycetota bacterium]REJ96628.1 MAG: N-acetyltransferase [Planctomycetota bacterium]REK20066.1 MAG: N-acetyltransferase [Planctomycetota bacterium]REK28354.1 MAG: N-acetyltransferase [Planctomycetota bacterium]
MNVPHHILTPRLRLRRHTPADLDSFVEFLADDDSTRYMPFTAEQKTRAGAEQMLAWVIASYESQDPICSLTIADRETDEYLGSCGLSPDPDGVELYYTLLTRHRGRGLATEAAAALLQHLWTETDAHRAVAHVVVDNEPSIRVARRLGFVDAGPIERTAATGDIEHLTLRGRRMILNRPE